MWLKNCLERARGLDGAAEQRFVDTAQVDIIEVKVQLRNEADLAAALTIDQDQPLDVELGVYKRCRWSPFPTSTFATSVCRLASTSEIR